MTDHYKNFRALYGTPASSITAAVDQKVVHGKALLQLGQDLDGHSRTLRQHVRDDLRAIAHVPKHPANVSRQLGTHVLYAAGCIKRLGAAATQFDTVVAKLNKQYSTAILTPPNGVSTGPDVTTLDRRYHRARQHLDHVAESCARMLRHPHNLDNVRRLVEHGFIPVADISHWPGVPALIADDINSGRFTDPRIALQLDYHLFSPEVQRRLAQWAHDHMQEIGTMLQDGNTLNLPPTKGSVTYNIPLIDTDDLKMNAILSLATGSGVMGLTLAGTKGGDPQLRGTLTGKIGDDDTTAAITDHGWSVKAEHTTGPDGDLGLDLDDDGLWVSGKHSQSIGTTTITEQVKVRVHGYGGGKPPAAHPAPTHVPVPDPFAPLTNFVHGTEEGLKHDLSSLGHAGKSELGHLKHNAGLWGDWLNKQLDGVGDGLRDPQLPTIPGLPGLPEIPVVPVV